MSMPTKGKHHHHLSHHHHHSQPQQSHHNPPQHQPQLLVNVNQQSVHSPQAYNTVVTTNAPRFIPNAGEYQLLISTFHYAQCFLHFEHAFTIFVVYIFFYVVKINDALRVVQGYVLRLGQPCGPCGCSLGRFCKNA